MKKLSTLLLLSLTAMFIFSCQKAESPITDPTEGTITTLTVAPPVPDADTKVSFDDLGTGIDGGMKLTWEAKVTEGTTKDGDIITIYDNLGNRVGNFECTAVDTDGNATFTALDGVSLTANTNYQAVYPKSDVTTLTARNATMATTLADQQQSTDDLTHLDKYLFMKDAAFIAGTTDKIDFTYEVSTYVMKFKWTDVNEATSVKLTDNTTESKSYKLSYTEGFTETEDVATAYFMIAANNTGGSPETRDLYFTVSNETANKGFVVSSNKLFAAGKTYRTPTIGDATNEYNAYIENGKVLGKGIPIMVGGTTVVWAPRNLGYHPTDFPYGKLYQWGRKDGQWFDGEYDANPTIAGSPCPSSTVPEAGTFYKSTEDPYDWTASPYSGADENAWKIWAGTDQQVGKVGNPCPTGWRVPTKDELDELEDNGEWKSASDGVEGQAGYWFSGDVAISSAGDNKIFFPAAGYRGSGGIASGRGSYGSYWSSTPYGTYAYGLCFCSGVANVDSGGRAFGFSVRCVQD